jgi:hypothetical protein
LSDRSIGFVHVDEAVLAPLRAVGTLEGAVAVGGERILERAHARLEAGDGFGRRVGRRLLECGELLGVVLHDAHPQAHRDQVAAAITAADRAVATARAGIAESKAQADAAKSGISSKSAAKSRATEQVKAAQAQLANAQSAVKTAEANLAAAESTAANADREAQRAANLLQQGAISNSQAEARQTAADNAREHSEDIQEQIRFAVRALQR